LNEQLLDMYFSPNIFWVIKVRKIRWVRHVGERTCMHGFAGENLTDTTWRLRRRWEDYIRMDVKEIGCAGVEWTDLAPDMEMVGSCEHSSEPSGSFTCGEFFSSWGTISYSRTPLQGVKLKNCWSASVWNQT
jgi:hypothetical protein